MSDLKTFQHHYQTEPRKVYASKIEYRGGIDIDLEKLKANRIINQHGLKLRVVSTATLASMKCFEVEEL